MTRKPANQPKVPVHARRSQIGVIGHHAPVEGGIHLYQPLPPQPVDHATLAAAQHQLAALPPSPCPPALHSSSISLCYFSLFIVHWSLVILPLSPCPLVPLSPRPPIPLSPCLLVPSASLHLRDSALKDQRAASVICVFQLSVDSYRSLV
jgi:hypothetical protein